MTLENFWVLLDTHTGQGMAILASVTSLYLLVQWVAARRVR